MSLAAAYLLRRSGTKTDDRRPPIKVRFPNSAGNQEKIRGQRPRLQQFSAIIDRRYSNCIIWLANFGPIPASSCLK
jgi:hypothetical protein